MDMVYLKLSSSDEGLFKFFRHYSRFFNEIHSQENLPVYFEIIEDAVVFIISNTHEYVEALSEFSKIPDVEYEGEKSKSEMQEELLQNFKVSKPPYEISFSSKSIEPDQFVNLVKSILSVVVGDYEIRYSSPQKLIVEFKNMDWFVNFFKNFQNRYVKLKLKK